METKEKTVKQLYDEFCAKYSLDQISHNQELSMVFAYLQYECSRGQGRLMKTPAKKMQDLVEKYLEYEYEKSPAIADKTF